MAGPTQSRLPSFLAFMDLSQQELPLTAYFVRETKEEKSRPASRKRYNVPQSVACSSKRRKSNVQQSAATPLADFAGQSKSRLKTLQLPTPTTSARKRSHDEPVKPRPTLTVGHDASKEDVAPLESPSKLPRSRCDIAEDDVIELPGPSLAIPLAYSQTTAKPKGKEFHRRSNHGDATLATPRTPSRRTSKPTHVVDDHSFLTRNYHVPFEPRQPSPASFDLGISQNGSHLAGSTAGLFDLGFSDPLNLCEEGSVLMQPDDVFAFHKQNSIQSKTLDDQPSDDHVIPVPSSQSQYLLHLDMTPKRKRCSRRVEHVVSSQPQEERELTVTTPRRPTVIVGLSEGTPSVRHTRGNVPGPRLSCGQSGGESFSSSATPSRSLVVTKALHKLPLMMNRESPNQNSIKHISPAYIEDSLTESEPESDILQTKMKDKSFALHLQAMSQVPRHSPVDRDACLVVRCGPAGGDLPEIKDDSATEAESDTEILRCLAEISRKRPREYRSEALDEDKSPRPIISPLVSPTRPRIVAMSLVGGLAHSFTQEDAELDIRGPRAAHSPTVEWSQTRIPSDSLPSVVQEFVRMFPGDESYPADFPESLRI